MPSLRFDSYTRIELNELAPTTSVVVPLGSTEQHGHHLPVAVDRAIITAVAERAVALASESVPVLVTPTVPFGFAHHHLPFGGTISITAETYAHVLRDIASSLAGQGFRRIVFLNGHGGNQTAMQFVADQAVYQDRLRVHLAAFSYWSVAGEGLIDIGLPPALVPGHAGHFETSVMLALDPGAVRLAARPHDKDASQPLGRPDIAGACVRREGLWESSDGRTDDAQLASAEVGERALGIISRRVAETIVEFYRSAP